LPESEVSIDSYIQPVTQQNESRTAKKDTSVTKVAKPLWKIQMVPHIPCHAHQFLSESESTSVIKGATIKNTGNFYYAKEAITCITKLTPFTVSKMNGTQTGTLVSP